VKVSLEPWGADDLGLLQQCLGDPAMMEHLGGPETPEKIAERQARYERPDSKQYKIVVDGEGAGWVGYWEREEHGEQVYETGWAVIPAFQGRGIATAATRTVIDLARAERKHRFLYAYPSVENGPSTGICRKLGFTLMRTTEYEYPKGSGIVMRCNDWRLDLFASREPSPG
jgi:RimJ/RimL family protein N-acetyltransferase